MIAKKDEGPQLTGRLVTQIEWLQRLVANYEKRQEVNPETLQQYKALLADITHAYAAIISYQSQRDIEHRLRSRIDFLEEEVEGLAGRLNEYTTVQRLMSTGELGPIMKKVSEIIEMAKTE